MIKQHRRDGRTGDLDLADVQKLSERQVRKRHTTVFNAEPPSAMEMRADEEQVWSRVTHQLAWERDIDLTASNNTVKTGTLVEESDDDMTSSHTSRTMLPFTPPDPPRTGSSNAGGGRRRAFDNAAFENDSLQHFVTSTRASTDVTTPSAGASRVLGRNNRVSPDVGTMPLQQSRSQSGESKRSSYPVQSSSKSSFNSDTSGTSLLTSGVPPAQERPIKRRSGGDVSETGV